MSEGTQQPFQPLAALNELREAVARFANAGVAFNATALLATITLLEEYVDRHEGGGGAAGLQESPDSGPRKGAGRGEVPGDAWPVGVMTTNLVGKITYANPQIEDLLGYRLTELVGRSLGSFLADTDKNAFDRYLAACNKGQCDDFEMHFTRRDKRDLWVSISLTPLSDGGTDALGSMAYVTDITTAKREERERTHLEEALKRALSLLDHAQASGNIGIWVVEDVMSGRGYCSPSYFALFGVPPLDRVPNQDEWSSWVHPDDRKRANDTLLKALASGGTYVSEFRTVWSDGSEHWLRIKGEVSHYRNGAVSMLGVVIDISEIRRLAAA